MEERKKIVASSHGECCQPETTLNHHSQSITFNQSAFLRDGWMISLLSLHMIQLHFVGRIHQTLDLNI